MSLSPERCLSLHSLTVVYVSLPYSLSLSLVLSSPPFHTFLSHSIILSFLLVVSLSLTLQTRVSVSLSSLLHSLSPSRGHCLSHSRSCSPPHAMWLSHTLFLALSHLFVSVTPAVSLSHSYVVSLPPMISLLVVSNSFCLSFAHTLSLFLPLMRCMAQPLSHSSSLALDISLSLARLCPSLVVSLTLVMNPSQLVPPSLSLLLSHS